MSVHKVHFHGVFFSVNCVLRTLVTVAAPMEMELTKKVFVAIQKATFDLLDRSIWGCQATRGSELESVITTIFQFSSNRFLVICEIVMEDNL